MKIDPIKLSTAKGFDQAFTYLISQPGATHLQSFERLNAIYEEATGEQRYADYNSYRVARRRRLVG